jgi:hypothetical protein
MSAREVTYRIVIAIGSFIAAFLLLSAHGPGAAFDSMTGESYSQLPDCPRLREPVVATNESNHSLRYVPEPVNPTVCPRPVLEPASPTSPRPVLEPASATASPLPEHPMEICTGDGIRADFSHMALTMCETPMVSLFMRQAPAKIDVLGVRLRSSSGTAWIPFYWDGDLDLFRVMRVRILDERGRSSGSCSIKPPPGNYVDESFFDCPLPPPPLLPGGWSLVIHWTSGAVSGHTYTIPLEMCTEPVYRMGQQPCASSELGAASSQPVPSTVPAPLPAPHLPRVGVCSSTLTSQYKTLSLGHIVPFIEFYRLSGVDYMLLYARADAYYEFAPLLLELYAGDAPAFVFDIKKVPHSCRDPFEDVEWCDQTKLMNSCLSHLEGRVDWVGCGKGGGGGGALLTVHLLR